MADDCRGTVPGCALTLLLLDAARAVEARAEGALGEIGLSLAERHCCGKSNVTQLVDRLEADGLVARESDLEDRRTVRATVTASGRAAYERASVLLAEHERSIDAQLGRGPRADLARSLKALREG
jgi:DNA-binding MarR family transcriptional regulator